MKAVLFVAGLVAMAVGGFGLLAPAAFRAGYGLGAGEISELSETRAAGGGLLAVGAVLLLGAFVHWLAAPAALVGAALYAGYGLSRLLSLAADGRPDGGLLVAAAVELILAAACAVTLRAGRR
ncbi:hypothetical protein GCM10010399_08000 [Dactylosporangium fulvum]